MQALWREFLQTERDALAHKPSRTGRTAGSATCGASAFTGISQRQ